MTESKRQTGFEAIQFNAEFCQCVNQTELCDIKRHRHTLTCRLREIMVTQEPIWPVNFCTRRRKDVGLESSCNKLMFCRNLDCLPLATEMDCLVLWCHVLGDAEASRKY